MEKWDASPRSGSLIPKFSRGCYSLVYILWAVKAFKFDFPQMKALWFSRLAQNTKSLLANFRKRWSCLAAPLGKPFPPRPAVTSITPICTNSSRGAHWFWLKPLSSSSMSGTALPTLNTGLQTGICTLQMLIPLKQKQAGDHLWGLSLLCQQSWDTTVMTALRNASEKFRLTSGSNKAGLSPPWHWKQLLIFIVSRLFTPTRICRIVVCQPGTPQTPLPLPPSKGRGEAGGSRAPPKS